MALVYGAKYLHDRLKRLPTARCTASFGPRSAADRHYEVLCMELAQVVCHLTATSVDQDARYFKLLTVCKLLQ